VKNDQEDGRGVSVLVINPGSTSTDTGLFEVSGRGWVRTLDHPEDSLEAFEHVLDQVDWREAEIARFIENEALETGQLRAVVGRGGLLRPLAGGISICAVRGGSIVDSTDALLGEGPFSPERAGTVPLAGMLALCLDGGRNRAEIVKLLCRGSGLKGYLGTGRLPEVFRMIDQGNAEARLVLDAMVLQIVKWIGTMAAVLMGRPDAILLTGGMAHSERFVAEITPHVSALAPIQVFPGSLEMEALAEGAFRVLNGKEDPLPY